MKNFVALATLFVAVHLLGETTSKTLVQTTPSATVSPPPPVVPAKPGVKKDEKPKPPKEPVIEGVTLPRSNGTFLGFQVVGGQIKVSFYDKKKKPMPVDVSRGFARWPNPRGPGQLSTPLIPGGTALVGSKPALPPYNYSISFNLLQGEGEDAKVVETYMVPFRG